MTPCKCMDLARDVDVSKVPLDFFYVHKAHEER